MIIRKTNANDITSVMNIFYIARNYMINNGNATQWENGYPNEDIVNTDISNGNSYVCIDDGEIVGTFSFIIGTDPTYQKIENGHWHQDKLYGTIHRLASNGQKKGIAKACFDFCISQIDYVRIDTHMDNLSMQAAIKKYGFQKCGTILVRNGGKRLAFDYSKNPLL